jgi:glucose-1-phosphate thymidylyltransferase
MRKGLKIVIPVAGAGTRMRPHTYAVPKALLPVAGKPVLSHILDPLLPLNPEEIIFVVGHLSEHIIEYVQSTYLVKTSFAEQKELLGLGYAIYLALQKAESGPVLIILGDTIARTDFKEFIKAGPNVIGLKEVTDPRHFGVAIVEEARVLALEEKPQNPKSDLALVGLYYFEKSEILREHLAEVIAEGRKTSGEIQLTDALEAMIVDGHEFTPFVVDGWYDCGSRENFIETNRLLLSEANLSADYPGSIIIPPVHIAESAIIEESIIGPYVSVSDNARINRSIIRDSIIGRRAHVEFSLLDQSLVGEKATVRGTYSHINIAKYAEIGNF